MNIFKRCMIFATFVGSCIAICFLVASLGTKKWVISGAKRTTNPLESNGKINFGLFDGKKELNVAYGWRAYDIDVVHLLKYEPEFLLYGLWLGTVISVCVAFLFSVISGISSAVMTVTRNNKCLTGTKRLYLWNFLSMLSNISAISLWVLQYYTRIQHNVLSREDKDNSWTSEGQADLGYSFWFVVGAAITHLVNIFIILIGNSNSRESNPIIPMIEEKSNGAIMLY